MTSVYRLKNDITWIANYRSYRFRRRMASSSTPYRIQRSRFAIKYSYPYRRPFGYGLGVFSDRLQYVLMESYEDTHFSSTLRHLFRRGPISFNFNQFEFTTIESVSCLRFWQNSNLTLGIQDEDDDG